MKSIKYKLEFRKRKSIGIIINEEGELLVRAPIGVSIDTIEKVLEKKKDWIEEKQKKFTSRDKLNSNEVMYLGETYTVKVIEQKYLKRNFIYLQDKTFLINVSNKDNAAKVLEKWFRERCLEKVSEYVNKYSIELKKIPIEVKVKEQKRKWGSCTYDNKILLNWRLIMAREKAIEYVVVHEMCHMIHKNHSKEFWREVEGILPQFKIEDAYLKEKGYLMKINI